jgi:hypothetical protein
MNTLLNRLRAIIAYLNKPRIIISDSIVFIKQSISVIWSYPLKHTTKHIYVVYRFSLILNYTYGFTYVFTYGFTTVYALEEAVDATDTDLGSIWLFDV